MMNAMVPDILLREVVKQFRGSPRPTLNGVNLSVLPGQIHTLLGHSGVGKSVTLKIILGLLKPDSGEVKIKGEDLLQADTRALHEMRKHFGMLFQNSALFDSLNVYENVAFPLREHRKDWDERRIFERVKDLLSMVELDASVEKMPAELSGGMRKRVGLARAIALEPEILLFDEPTTGLDPVTSQVIDDLIVKTTRSLGASALVISHNVHAALRISDCVSMISEGTIIETAPPSRFVRSENEKVRHFLQSAGVI